MMGNSKNRRQNETSAQGNDGMTKHRRECLCFCAGTAGALNLHDEGEQDRAVLQATFYSSITAKYLGLQTHSPAK